MPAGSIGAERPTSEPASLPSSPQSRNARLLVALLVAVMLAGVALRAYPLDRKVFGFDESVTSVRAAGRTLEQFRRFAFDGKVHRFSDLADFQRPALPTSASDTVASLAVEDPQHPPLYYLIQRAWVNLAGASIVMRRIPSLVFAMLLLPAMFWLGCELFGERLRALFAAALVAASPFHIAYAQQAREYSLWTLAIVVSTASLLAAIRTGRPLWWVAYAASLALGLYTDPLIAYVAVAHAVFVWFAARKATRAFLAAIAGAVAAFGPWIWVLWTQRHVVSATTAWLDVRIPLPLLGVKWAFSAGTVFFDLDYIDARLIVLAALAVVFAIGALVALARADKRTAWLLCPLAVIPALAIVLPDLILGQSRSTQSRYFVPVWLALELAVAWAAGSRPARSASTLRRMLPASAGVAVCAAGLLCAAISAAWSSWWIDSADAPLPAIARAIDVQPNPLLASVSDPYYVLQLSNYVRGDVAFAVKPGTAPGALSIDSASANDAGSPGKKATLLAVAPPSALTALQRAQLREIPVAVDLPARASAATRAARAGFSRARGLGSLDDAVVRLWLVTPR